MSGGGSSRVSIPSSERKIIQDIKEIARNHSDEEIYAMLKECSMDPNETAQKLLFQDTFHEVKRKRDRRKENLGNREQTEPWWRPGMQGRGTRGGRGGYYSRYQSHDAGGISAAKEDEANQMAEKRIPSSSPVTQETDGKSEVPASSSGSVANDPIKGGSLSSSCGSLPQMPHGGSSTLAEDNSVAESTKVECALSPPVDTKHGPANVVSVACRQPIPTSDQFPSNMAVPVSVVPASDAALVPTIDTHVSDGTNECEVGNKETTLEHPINKGVSHGLPDSGISYEKASSESGGSFMQGKMATKSQGQELNYFSSSGSKPSSNYGSRSQQVIGPQKVGPNMEWKPKLTNQVPAQTPATTITRDVSPATVETDSRAVPITNSRNPKESTSNLQKKLEELHFSESQHVIIPDHLQVPEAERSGLSFGSFDASFGLETRPTLPNGADSERSSILPAESSQGPKENAGGPTSSTQNDSSSAQQEHPDHSQAPSQIPENLPSEEADAPLDVPAVPDHEQLKQAAALAQGSSQILPLHTSPLYSAFGLVPPVLGGQFAPFEGSEAQAREPSAVASFIQVQQPFDPSANYYTQIYQPGADGDGRFSPYLAPGGTAKYNGNTATLPSQTSQSVQEQTASSPMLPTTGITTQAGGAAQTSVAIAQQHLPAYRQPAGVHMPQYPPNYMPYGHYFSPFYVPTPPLHPFFSSTAFPQQPMASSLYPPPAAAAAAATPVKYSQYKSGTGGSNPSHSAVPPSNGPYSSGQPGYTSTPPVIGSLSAVNDDPSATQYKDNNVYIPGQQSEGGTVWIPSPGRDLPGLQAGSFYNLPPGQHVPFAAAQSGNNPFAGVYHPAQSLGAAAAAMHPMLQPPLGVSGSGGAEMAAQPGGVYQQPQRAQMNWAGNY